MSLLNTSVGSTRFGRTLRSLAALGGSLFVWLWLSHCAQAQDNAVPAVATGAVGSIFGQITEADTSRELTNVTVRVVGSGFQVRSGSDGRYSILGLAPGSYDVEFSLAGYSRQSLRGILVKSGEATRTDVSLALELFELPLLEVMADPLDDYATELRLERFESSSLVENIGSDLFSRLGAGDASEIITKATGISVVEGKFAVVRGLSDRYNLALLNGADIPTADPYRKSAQLDLFPSDVIESVVISKTFTPDLPGGFAGAVSDIRTKSFPDKFTFKASIGVGYNTQSTFNDDFLTYEGGGRDAFGMDDGTRALPADLENLSGGELQQLRTIAQFGLPGASEAAAEMDRLTRSFGTPYMGPTTESAPLDRDLGILMGDSFLVGDNQIGYFAGLNYELDHRFYDDGVRARYIPSIAGGSPAVQEYYQDARSLTKAQWSGLLNVGYRYKDLHDIAFNFLYSQVGEDEARQLVGKISSLDQFANDDLTHRNILYYTERNLTSFQLKGTHQIEPIKLQVDWLAGLATTYQDEPDVRYLNLVSSPIRSNPAGPERLLTIHEGFLPQPNFPVRYFRHLEDETVNWKLDLTRPFEDARELEWKLKAGIYSSESERDFTERSFSYDGQREYTNNPYSFPNQYNIGENFRPPYLDPPPFYTFDRYLESRFGNGLYDGTQEIEAYYGMLDIPIVESLVLSGGARYETTYLEVNAAPFRSPPSTGLIDQADLLPAASLTWSIRDDMKVRASYAETVARPTYREFAAYASFDQVTIDTVIGNPRLQMSSIQNYDLRWEWFTRQGGLVSIGGFYKTIQNPIEQVNGEITPDGELNLGGDKLTFINGPEAVVSGLEFEGRQNLGVFDPALDAFSMGVNFAWINSEIDNLQKIQDIKLINTGKRVPTRPLYDQSPYIINADLSYDNQRSGTSVTVAYNFAAERLALITNSYDVYEQGAAQLDVTASQRLGKNWKIKFSAKNLLNPEVIRSYDYLSPTDTSLVYSSYTRGITFGLSLGFEF